MELVVLHVGQLGACLGGQGDAVAGGHGGVGGVGVDLPRAAGGDKDSACADATRLLRWGAFGAGQVGGDDAAVGDHQIGDHGPLGKADALVDAGKSNQGAADFSAGGVAVGVKDAGQRVRAFAGTKQLARPRRSKSAPHSISSATRIGPSVTSACAAGR